MAEICQSGLFWLFIVQLLENQRLTYVYLLIISSTHN